MTTRGTAGGGDSFTPSPAAMPMCRTPQRPESFPRNPATYPEIAHKTPERLNTHAAAEKRREQKKFARGAFFLYNPPQRKSRPAAGFFVRLGGPPLTWTSACRNLSGAVPAVTCATRAFPKIQGENNEQKETVD